MRIAEIGGQRPQRANARQIGGVVQGGHGDQRRDLLLYHRRDAAGGGQIRTAMHHPMRRRTQRAQGQAHGRQRLQHPGKRRRMVGHHRRPVHRAQRNARALRPDFGHRPLGLRAQSIVVNRDLDRGGPRIDHQNVHDRAPP